jgi:hypothetical protein
MAIADMQSAAVTSLFGGAASLSDSVNLSDNALLGTRFNDHDFCVPAVDHDAGQHSVGAVDRVSSKA